MTDATVPSSVHPPRWNLLKGIWILGLIALGYVRLGGVQDYLRTTLTLVTVLLTLFLSVIWLVFLSRMLWSTRFKALGAVAVVVIALMSIVRIKEFYGDILPILTWRWEPPKDTTLAALPESAKTVLAPAAVIAPVVPVSTALTDDDFAQFLGNRRNARVEIQLSKNPADWPPKELWRMPIGAGWSGFVVLGNKALTQEQRGEKELVTCYEKSTGKPLWAHSENVRFSETMGGDGPRATPTIVEGKVYALGATGILSCLDLETGTALWTRDTLKDAVQENLMWGKSCSPLVVGDVVVISLGKSKDRTLAAYNKFTGADVWRAGHDEAGYASPIFATICGTPQILAINHDSITAHDPKTGEILWENAFPGAPAKCTNPVALDGDRVFASCGYGVGCKMLKIEKTPDGKLAAKELWKNIKFKTKFCNILVKDNFAYSLDEGALTCLDLTTGDRAWKDTNYGHGQVLLAGDVIIVQAESGEIALVEASPKAFKEIVRFPALKAKTWNNPILAGKLLLVRNAEEAICFEVPVPK